MLEVDEILTPEELAKLWKIRVSTIYTWSSEGRLPIPPIRFNRCLRFRKADAVEYIHRQGTQALA